MEDMEKRDAHDEIDPVGDTSEARVTRGAAIGAGAAAVTGLALGGLAFPAAAGAAEAADPLSVNAMLAEMKKQGITNLRQLCEFTATTVKKSGFPPARRWGFICKNLIIIAGRR